jgi:hypothetical protein
VVLTGLCGRFWLPGAMCLCLWLAAAADQRWPGARRLPWVASLLLLVGTLLHGRLAYRSGLLEDVQVAVGARTLDERNGNDSFWRVSHYLNANTPADARVLVAALFPTFGISSGDSFWIDRSTFVTDSHLQGFIKLDAWPSFLASVRGADIGFVVLSDQVFNAGRHGFSFVAGRNEYPFARRLADELGQKVYEFDHLQIYRLVPSVRPGGNRPWSAVAH